MNGKLLALGLVVAAVALSQGATASTSKPVIQGQAAINTVNAASNNHASNQGHGTNYVSTSGITYNYAAAAQTLAQQAGGSVVSAGPSGTQVQLPSGTIITYY